MDAISNREAVRQERVTFDHLRWQDRQWFLLRLAMGYVAAGILTGVIATATYILINAQLYPQSVVTTASGALFVEVIGVILGVWKIVIVPKTQTILAPTTVREIVTTNSGAA